MDSKAELKGLTLEWKRELRCNRREVGGMNSELPLCMSGIKKMAEFLSDEVCFVR